MFMRPCVALQPMSISDFLVEHPISPFLEGLFNVGWGDF